MRMKFEKATWALFGRKGRPMVMVEIHVAAHAIKVMHIWADNGSKYKIDILLLKGLINGRSQANILQAMASINDRMTEAGLEGCDLSTTKAVAEYIDRL